MYRFHIAMALVVLGASLATFDLFSSEMMYFLLGMYGFLTVGDIVYYWSESAKKQKKMEVSGQKAVVNLDPVLQKLEDGLSNLPPQKLPDTLVKQLQSQSNQSALVAQSLSVLIKKVDHLTTAAGFQVKG